VNHGSDKRQESSGKSSNFAAEIHSRNGLILFHGILVVALPEGYRPGFAYQPHR
jgi:hypothetical protein